MPFDPVRYEQEVIRPLRGSHGRLPDGDQHRRYAVEIGMTKPELEDRLRTVRAFWRQRANGPDSRAEVCRLLLAEDERLRQSAGTAMDDPKWWRELRQASPEWAAAHILPIPRAPLDPPRSPEDPVEDPAREADPPDDVDADGDEQDAPAEGDDPGEWEVPSVKGWQHDAHDLVRQRLARARRQPAGGWQTAIGKPRPVPVDPPREPGAGSPVGGTRPDVVAAEVDDLTVVALGAHGSVSRVRISWPEPGDGQVRIRRWDRPPPWETGTSIDAEELARFGEPVSGPLRSEGGIAVLEADVPVGYHVYVLFVVHSGGVVVGPYVGRGVAEPVLQLYAERMGDQVVLSWLWPSGATLAEVEWVTPAGAATERISRAEYTEERGCRIDAGRVAGVVRVWAVTVTAGGEVRSKPAEVSIVAAPVQLTYRIERATRCFFFRSRRRSVRVAADRDCVGVRLSVIVAPGLVMPLNAGQGQKVGTFESLALRAGESQSFDVEVPRPVHRRRPYWIRCFAESPVPLSVVDPPIVNMKVT
jgi:hypothetical protein